MHQQEHTRSDVVLSRATTLLIIGNLFDALFTFTYLQLDVASEVNPLMRWAYEGSPMSFILLKLSCVQLGVLLLWAQRHVPVAGMAIWATAGLYVAIVAYHMTLIAQLPV